MSQLTKDTIARAALDLIDRDTLDALSMRKLGQMLGVDAKAVYYYFPNKEALMTYVLEVAFKEMQLPDEPTGNWQAQLREIALAYATLASKHPHLLPYLIAFDGSVPAVFDIVERMATALQDTGLAARSIIQIIDLFSSFVPYYALASGAETMTSQQIYRQIMALPEQQFPVAKAMLRSVEHRELDEDVDFQLDILIMGIEALITRETS